ncbi:YwhD family protein [Paenibacillus taiwanensis]|uniref:YwhD family protein n=1 Tax=Paenibacillus taiwanensis TaxID=401638 RepID=UPI00040018BC|nr:YwhD family protein [Paenibacillus taiwanensis]
MEQEKKVKKPLALNVVSSGKHKGFGAGSIDLNNVSPVMIEGGRAYIDIGAMHAKSKLERGIKFSANKEDVPNGRTCWIVWVAVDRNAEGGFYAGLTACEMLIDAEAKRGWKILAEHVNKMDAAMKRRVMLDGLGEEELGLLRGLLQTHNEEWWANTSEEVKAALV